MKPLVRLSFGLISQVAKALRSLEKGKIPDAVADLEYCEVMLADEIREFPAAFKEETEHDRRKPIRDFTNAELVEEMKFRELT